MRFRSFSFFEFFSEKGKQRQKLGYGHFGNGEDKRGPGNAKATGQ